MSWGLSDQPYNYLKAQTMKTAWQARGFNKDFEHKSYTTTIDPRGEEAYQLAFIENAKMNPPRVPCPNFYTRSPSACAYIEKRNAILFPKAIGGPRIPNDSYVPPASAIHKERLESCQLSVTSPSATSPSQAFGTRLPVLEPPMSAPGPSRILR